MSATEWRPVFQASMYEVSDQGEVRSYRTWRGNPGPRILTNLMGNRGYYNVSIVYDDGSKQRPTLHSVVARAFLGERPDGMQVRHLNGNRTDNRAANLAYGTVRENYADMLRHRTHPMARRTHCKNGHAFTPGNTRIESTSKGGTFRRCLTCERANQSGADRLAQVKQQAFASGATSALLMILLSQLSRRGDAA